MLKDLSDGRNICFCFKYYYYVKYSLKLVHQELISRCYRKIYYIAYNKAVFIFYILQYSRVSITRTVTTRFVRLLEFFYLQHEF